MRRCYLEAKSLLQSRKVSLVERYEYVGLTVNRGFRNHVVVWIP